jgi:hypothetical protein
MPVVERAQQSVGVEHQPLPEPVATERIERREPRKRPSSYDRYAGAGAEGTLLIAAGWLWYLNAIYTANAVVLLGGPFLVGVLVAAGITWIEQYLWRQRPDATIVLIVLLVSGIDIITSLIGLAPALANHLPGITGGLSTNPATWLELREFRIYPALCIVLSIIIAIAPEPTIKYFWKRFKLALSR